MNPFSIIMFCFSGAILLYAGIMGLTGDSSMLRKQWAVKIDDKKAYARKVAKILAITALAPALGGTVGLFSTLAGLIALFVGLVVFIWLGVKIAST